MDVINESRVDFKYRPSEQSPIITKTTFSNLVATTIVDNTLVVEKFVNKDSASIYDILAYRIDITNISNEIINNVILKDILPRGAKFINNTLLINKVTRRCVNPMDGILLGSICAKAVITITFKAVVDRILPLKTLVNSCAVTFDYLYNIEKPPFEMHIYSNDIVTVSKDNLFKQFLVKNNVNIPDVCGTIDLLIGVKTKVKIIDTKIVKYVINPKMYNAIFIGVLTYKVYYISRGKICTFTCIQGFSTTQLVPKGVEYFKKVQVEVYNEHTSYILTDKCNLFIATSLLVKCC